MRFCGTLALAVLGALPWRVGAADRVEMHEAPVSKTRAQALSALYPGLGQLAVGRRDKGTAMVVAHTGFLVVWLTSHADYNTHREQFALEETRYLSLREGGSFEQAEESWQRLRSRKDDLDRAHALRVSFSVLTGVLYGYNLADAFLLGGVEAPAAARAAVVPLPVGGRLGLALVARLD